MSLLQRFYDWRLEREIHRLSHACREAYAAGDKAQARHFFHAMGRAMASRSRAQIQRMERRLGVHRA